MSERRAILTHYRTEEAKAFRRIHGDTGGGASIKTNITG